MVGVQQHGGLAVRGRHAGDHSGRTAVDGGDAHLGHAGVLEQSRNGLSAAAHRLRVIPLESNRRDTDQGLEVRLGSRQDLL